MTNQHDNDKSQNTPEDPQAGSTIENLIQMNEKPDSSKKPSELNARLDDIESELRHLNAREAATNKAFRELLSDSKRLGDEQSQQLQQARQQITSLQEDYRKLSQDAQRLAAGANILSANIEQARSETSAEITALKINTDESIEKINNDNLGLLSRAATLEERANQLSNDLDTRVNVINSTIAAVESKMQQQIDEMAQQSEQRDEALAIRSDMIEQEFHDETAKLRNADDELANRALALEVSSKRLSEESEDLQQQTYVLDGRSSALEERSENLENQTEEHADKLAIVNSDVQRHAKGFALALTLIALTLGAITLMQQNRWRDAGLSDNGLQKQISQQAQNNLAAQQQTTQQLTTLQSSSTEQLNKLQASDQQLDARISAQQAEIAALKQDLQQLEQQTDNTVGRINAMTPYRQFGLDNTVHNDAWLAQQDKQAYVIEIATVTNKQDVFNIAYRWSRQLNQSHLSVIESITDNGSARYTLVYGTFADQQAAADMLRRLPVIDYRSRPQARQLAELL
ncbi:MAG: hypothetical protein PVG66_12970 [Chromatiales bacterium]|jgi:uncharacterized protein YoxC